MRLPPAVRRSLCVEDLEPRLAPATLTTFDFQLPAHVANQGVQLALFGNVPSGTAAPTQMKYLTLNTTTSQYEYQPVPTPTTLQPNLTLIQLSPQSSTNANPMTFSLPLPDDQIQGGAAVLFVGSTVGIPLQNIASYTTGVVAVPTVSTNPNDVFGLFELTNLTTTSGLQLDVDISEVDQLGFTFTVTSSNAAPYPLAEVGISRHRDDLFAQYQNTFATSNTEFLESLVLGQNAAGDQLRLVAPQTILGTLQGGGPLLQSATQGSSGTGGLTPGTAYYYVVTAISGTGETTASVTRAYGGDISSSTTSVTLAWQPYTGSTYTTGYNIYRGVGQAPDSNGSHPPALDQFQLIGTATGASASSFTDTGLPAGTATPPVSNYGFDPLSTYFTAEIQNFFHYYRTHDFVYHQAPQIAGDPTGTVWKGRTEDVVPDWPAPYTTTQTYTRLKLTGEPGGEAAGLTVYVYMPLFSTNTNLQVSALTPYLPPMPGWMSSNLAETPGQMVFGCDGAFASNTTDPDVLNSTNPGLLKLALGNIENVIVSAFNRGLATLSPDCQPDQWVNPQQFANDPVPTTGGSLASGQNYYYVMTTVDAAGNETVPTREVKATLSASQTAVTLSWVPVDSAVAASYNVYRGTTPGSWTKIANVTWVPPVNGVQSYTDTGGGSSYVSATPPPWTFYSGATRSNLYAKFLHQNSTTDPVNGVSLNGLVYGYPFDDQGNFSTNIQYPAGQFPTTITFQLNPWSSDEALAIQSPAVSTAGTPFPVTVRGETGMTIRFASSDSQAVLPGTYTFQSGDNGTKQFTVTLKTAGTQSVEVLDVLDASLTATALVNDSAADATQVSFVSTPAFTFVGTPLPAVTVAVLDAYGNRVSGNVPVTLALNSGPGGFRGLRTVTAVNGLATFTGLTPTRQGTYTFKASTASLPTVVSPPVTASATTRFFIHGPKSTYAGHQMTITVLALDSANRVDPTYRGTVRFASNDRRAELPASYTFTAADRGRHTFTLRLQTVGRRSVFALDTRKSTVRGERLVHVVPSTTASFRVTGFPPRAHAGDAGRFTVTAIDAEGNVVPAYQGVVYFSSSDPAATLPAPVVFGPGDGGTRTFTATLRTVGNHTLTAQAGGVTPLTGSHSAIQVYRVSPDVTGRTQSVRGQPVTFRLAAVTGNGPTGATYRYLVNWGDGSPVLEVSGPAAVNVGHAYAAAGSRTVRLTVIDAAGHRGTATHAIQTTTTLVGAEGLFVGGTAGNDVITLAATNPLGTDVTVTVNGVNQGTFTPGWVHVYGGAGNDALTVQTAFISPLAVPVSLYGGAGDDRLDATGSTAANALLGEAGDDTLVGSGLLIGGTGRDRLTAGSRGAVLIGDRTAFDANAAALAGLLAEWGSPSPYVTRVSDLQGHTPGANGAYHLTPVTVLSDGELDELFGGLGADWFIVSGVGSQRDRFSGAVLGEEVSWM